MCIHLADGKRGSKSEGTANNPVLKNCSTLTFTSTFRNDQTDIEDDDKIMMTKMMVTLLKVMMMILIVHLSLLLPDTLHPHILWRPEVCLLFSNRGGRRNEGGGGLSG